MRLSATRLSAMSGVASSANPLIRRAAFIGSSSVEHFFATGSGGNNRYMSNQGFGVWTCAILRQRLMLAYNAAKNTYEFGIYGAYNSTILSTCVPQAIASSPDVAFMYVSHNDLAGGFASNAQMLASTQSIYNALLAGGVKKIVVMAPGPRNVGVAGGSGIGYWAKQVTLIASLSSWCSSAGIPFFNGNPYVQDQTTGDWLTGYTYDGAHPSVIGAIELGSALATWCLANLNLGPEPLIGTRLSSLVGPNPTNTGGSATNALQRSTFPNSKGTPYLETPVDGSARWQGFNNHSPDATYNYSNTGSAAVPLATAGLAAGQYVRSWVEMRVNAGGNPMQWQCGASFDGTGITRTGHIDGGNTPPLPYVAPNYPTAPVVFAGPVIQIPANATTVIDKYGMSRVVNPGVTNWAIRYGGLEIVSGYNTPSI